MAKAVRAVRVKRKVLKKLQITPASTGTSEAAPPRSQPLPDNSGGSVSARPYRKKTSYKKYSTKLERPWVQLKLIRELAQGEKTQTQLAKEYGVVQQAISFFSQRHADRINEVKNDIDNKFAGLWIANKESRLAAYMDQLQAISRRAKNDPAMMRAAQNALKSAAEELGHLPGRLTVVVDDKRVNYKVEGVDLGKLK